MTNLLKLTVATRLWLTLLIGITTLLQTIAVVLTHYKTDLHKNAFLEKLLEFLILSEIILFALMFGKLLNGYKIGLVIPTGYTVIRIIMFLTVITLFIVLKKIRKNNYSFIAIVASIIALPIVESMFSDYYRWLFIATLLALLIRSVYISIESVETIKNNISALSVTHAIDTLNTGLLYSENDGHIILSNNKMHDLMLKLTGTIYRNANTFYDYLISNDFETRFKKVEVKGQTVFLLPNDNAWMFTRKDVVFNNKNYCHISASDVSKQWELTQNLQDQNEILKEKSSILKERIDNLYFLSKEKELEYARNRAHDILGQKLSVMLRSLHADEKVDHSLLKDLSKDLMKKLVEEDEDVSSLDQVSNIQNIFNTIGVDIDFEGEFPLQKEKSALLFDIIREGTTNAVRHGLATEIKIRIDENENHYYLSIANNGYTPNEPIIWGSGIKEIQNKVLALGGKLDIKQYPLFELAIKIPGGE